MRKIMILVLCGFIFIGSGCSRNTVSLQDENADSRFPVIVYLETKGKIVAVMSGYGRTIYTVTAKDGEILGEELSERELQAKLPEIYHLVKTSYTGEESKIWAGE
ncbi:MAG: hypothetical protein PVH77_09030 [Phycisphaerales bacterium]